MKVLEKPPGGHFTYEEIQQVRFIHQNQQALKGELKNDIKIRLTFPTKWHSVLV